MTEYDYSDEGYKQYKDTQRRISRWVNDTNSHSDEYKSPFGARSDVGSDFKPASRSFNPSPVSSTIRSRHRPHEYHGSTSGSSRDRGLDVRRSSSVHHSSPRARRDSTSSESTYYDPDGPGPMPIPPPAPSYPLRASAIPPRQLAHLVDSVSRSQSQQSRSRHSSHGNRSNAGSNHSRSTATRSRTLPMSGPPQTVNVVRSASLPRPFPHNDSVSLTRDHYSPHHSSSSNSHHHRPTDHGRHHHGHLHSHHHHHHDRPPRSRSTGPSTSQSHSGSSGKTYAISSPTYIAPASLGNSKPLIVPYSHRPGDRGYYAPDEIHKAGPGYTIIPQKGTMVKVVVS